MKHAPIDVPTPLLGPDALRQLQRDMAHDLYTPTLHDLAVRAWREQKFMLERWARRFKPRPAITLALYAHELRYPVQIFRSAFG